MQLNITLSSLSLLLVAGSQGLPPSVAAGRATTRGGGNNVQAVDSEFQRALLSALSKRLSDVRRDGDVPAEEQVLRSAQYSATETLQLLNRFVHSADYSDSDSFASRILVALVASHPDEGNRVVRGLIDDGLIGIDTRSAVANIASRSGEKDVLDMLVLALEKRPDHFEGLAAAIVASCSAGDPRLGRALRALERRRELLPQMRKDADSATRAKVDREQRMLDSDMAEIRRKVDVR